MFRDATLRLTALYVGILVVICLFFSLNLYRVSSRELDSSLGRQMMFFQNNPRFQNLLGDDYLDARESQLEEGRQHIIVGLVYIDALIILLGGVGSYFLARRTLRPIAEAHEAQVRFTADASHELRTPIAAMQAEIEVALRDKKLTLKDSTQLLKSNLEELAKLSGLATGLLQLTRPEREIPTQPLDFQSVTDEAISRVAATARQKKITIRQVVKVKSLVPGDQPSLVTLLTILLDNAIKYSPSGSAVSIDVRLVGKELVIIVRDEGRGIAAADLPHIFDRFYRASPGGQEKVEGYGLGLSIAQNIVLSHGGTISIATRLGRGSAFTVKLPT